MTRRLSARSSISVAQSAIARVIPRRAAVYSAILLVAWPIYLYFFSTIAPSSEDRKIPHPEGPGFHRDHPSVYTINLLSFFAILRKSISSKTRDRKRFSYREWQKTIPTLRAWESVAWDSRRTSACRVGYFSSQLSLEQRGRWRLIFSSTEQPPHRDIQQSQRDHYCVRWSWEPSHLSYFFGRYRDGSPEDLDPVMSLHYRASRHSRFLGLRTSSRDLQLSPSSSQMDSRRSYQASVIWVWDNWLQYHSSSLMSTWGVDRNQFIPNHFAPQPSHDGRE